MKELADIGFFNSLGNASGGCSVWNGQEQYGEEYQRGRVPRNYGSSADNPDKEECSKIVRSMSGVLVSADEIIQQQIKEVENTVYEAERRAAKIRTNDAEFKRAYEQRHAQACLFVRALRRAKEQFLHNYKCIAAQHGDARYQEYANKEMC